MDLYEQLATIFCHSRLQYGVCLTIMLLLLLLFDDLGRINTSHIESGRRTASGFIRPHNAQTASATRLIATPLLAKIICTYFIIRILQIVQQNQNNIKNYDNNTKSNQINL